MKRKRIRQQNAGIPAFAHFERLIRRKREARKESTADLYRATTNWLRVFRGKGPLQLHEITAAFVDGFHDFLLGLGRLKTNTVNSYMSNFRSMYNQLVREGLVPRQAAHPFAYLTLRTEKTPKRAVAIDTIREITRLDLSGEPELEWARDLSLFAFLGCGIPFVDLAHLTRDNIVNGELAYNRVKTNTLIRVRLTKGMRRIIDKYRPGNDTPYLFPALTLDGEGESSHEGYKRDLRRHNDCLKRIGDRLAVPFRYTSYVMRHSWATEALRKNTAVAVISQALGHTSEKTTRNYLAELDQSTLNAANAIITGEIDAFVARGA